MATKSLAPERKSQMARLFKDMQFCPICGGKLKLLGTTSSEIKECDQHHGTMYVVGKRADQAVGIFLEAYEE